MGYGNQRVNQEIKLKGIMRTLSFRSSIKETNCQIETKVLGILVKTDNPPLLITISISAQLLENGWDIDSWKGVLCGGVVGLPKLIQ